jgi:phenylacetate-CoA ligase
VGELVFTTLTREAMPVIRYRTRDLTRLEPGTARPMFRRMGRITGRSDDMMIIRGVNVFPTQIEEETLLVEGLSPHFVCVLRRPGRMDEMVVRVEARESVPTDTYQALARDLSGRVKRNIGVTTGVEVVPPGTLERSVGKIKRIIDERHLG